MPFISLGGSLTGTVNNSYAWESTLVIGGSARGSGKLKRGLFSSSRSILKKFVLQVLKSFTKLHKSLGK